jgi:hypothetical protein
VAAAQSLTLVALLFATFVGVIFENTSFGHRHPCVLVRLPRIRLDALRDLVVGADRFVNVQMRIKPDAGNHRGTIRPSRDRADRS